MSEALAFFAALGALKIATALVFVGAIYATIRGFMRATRVNKPFQELAARLGLTYNGGGLGFLGRMKLISEYGFILSCIQQQVERKQGGRKSSSLPFPANILEGVFEGRRVCAFQVGSGGRSLGSVFILEHERSFPELRIYPEQGGFFGRESRTDIDLDSVEFTDAFVVKSPDKKFAYDICHPRMMDYLLRNPQFCLVFKRNAFLLWFEGPLRPEHVEPRLRHLLAIRDLLPDYREGADRETVRGRAVEAAGRRLRMRFRGWDPAADNPFRTLSQFQMVQDRNWLHVLEAAYEGRAYHILDYLPDRGQMMEEAPVLNRKWDIAPGDVRGFTCFTCALPQACPDLGIFPESDVTFKLFTRDIEFGGDALGKRFSDTFVITCKDERFARTLCHRGLMEYLLAHPDLALETRGRVLALSAGLFVSLPTAQFGVRLRQLEEVYQLIPGRLLVVDSPGAPRPSIVHEDDGPPPIPGSSPPPLTL